MAAGGHDLGPKDEAIGSRERIRPFKLIKYHFGAFNEAMYWTNHKKPFFFFIAIFCSVLEQHSEGTHFDSNFSIKGKSK